LSTWEIIKTRGTNSLTLCDDTLFDEPFVERTAARASDLRRQRSGRHPPCADRQFRELPEARAEAAAIAPGSVRHADQTMASVEAPPHAGQSDLDYLATLPMCRCWWVDGSADAASRVLPRARRSIIGHVLSLLITVSVGHVFAGADEAVQPMIARMAKFPGSGGSADFFCRSERAAPAHAADPARRSNGIRCSTG